MDTTSWQLFAEVFCDELNEDNDLQIEQNKEIPSPSVEFKVSSAGFKDVSPETPSTSTTREVSPTTSNMKTEIHSIQNQSENKTSIEKQQSGKLQRVLSELKIAAIPIPEHLRQRLIEIVRNNIDAFAG